ncbi:MAG: hypothetical protein M3436_11790 [Pseudomonadota bacterium]|nr:hypothetical protein [Pseudomonadota bacterium]
MMVRIVVLAIAIALPLERATASESLTLKGIVTDANTKEPVAGALVGAAGGVARFDAVADSSGFFALPLAQGVAPGTLVRLRGDKAGYRTYDQQVAVSSEAVLQVSLSRVEGETGPSIEKVLFLDHGDPRTLEIELHLSNPGGEAVWFDHLSFNGEVALNVAGFSGMISRVDYEVDLKSELEGGIRGQARESGTGGTPYPVKGYFRALTDTKSRGERSWAVGFTTPFPVKLDAKDKLVTRFRLTLKAGGIIRREQEGSSPAMTTMGIKRKEFALSLVTDKGRTVTWKIDDDRVLRWVSVELEKHGEPK